MTGLNYSNEGVLFQMHVAIGMETQRTHLFHILREHIHANVFQKS